MAYDSTNTGAEVDAAVAKVKARAGDLVDGSGNANKVTKFFGTNTITDSIITDSGSAVTVAGALEASGDLTVDTTTLKVDSTNNRVGIGTASPQGPLHVVDGTATGQTASSLGHGIVLDSKSDPMGVSFLSDAGEKASIFFGDTDSNDRGRIEYDHDGDRLIFRSSADILFLEGSDERMRVDSGGNVGIGEVSPTKLLHVKSPNSDTAETVAAFGNGDITEGLEIKTNGNGGSSLDWGFNAKNTRNLVFDTNQTERMRISSSGEVGIGDNDPSKELVVKNISTAGTESVINIISGNAAVAGIYFGDSDDDIVGGVVYDNSADTLQLRSSNNQTAVTIDSSERVGIGTTPSHKLDVNSGSTNQVALFKSTDATALIELADDTGSVQIITPQNGGLRLATGGSSGGVGATSGLFIDETQNVGINDDTPSYKLDVNGTGRFVSDLKVDSDLEVSGDISVAGTVKQSGNVGNLIIQGGDTAGANIELYGSNHATTSIRNNAYYDAAVHVFRPVDGSASNFLITTAGDVAIGPAAPAHALDVTGTGRFSTGVTFGSDTADANKLDDYEEGTWTPQITFGGGNTGVAYTYQVGTYTKIGDLVTASCYMSLSSKGSSTGAAVLTNLPFASRNLTANLVPAALRLSNISFADFPMGWNQVSSTDIHLQETTNAGTTTNLTDANFSNSSEVMISISYRV